MGKSLDGDCELVFLFGIGNRMWLENGKKLSRNYKQGYRVYDSHGAAAAQTANGGGIGGTTGLYLVRRNKKGDTDGE